MCGRFSFYQAPETVAELFQLAGIPQIKPRYNIAPTQSVSTVLQQEETQERQFQMMRWGLIPFWAKDVKMGAKLINARSETVSEKPSFRSPFKHRRCWILADGFYEWETTDSGKQPFYFQLKDGEPFAFAGLWERWQSPEGESIESCTILTTEANELMSRIHVRMPVILSPTSRDRWLDSATPPEELHPLLTPYDSQEMIGYPVSRMVNTPKTDSPDCVQRIAGGEE
ncbi:SOS response-associated peptidase [Phormidium pseudopriestleyi FRX01]|uniref:Abasic site processing protein n=1 Tax=Phormidium pseudopriestleyi FRX01 TaxID=1759528 RepID=A0ABS3FL59_9CYAN|nr:SOS response-associated peptidase [Phormidium pseudopriestleyi]MBO0347627.1 SOS response-associated peptidase [Phormidium pseudopriestleyi FRX01]